jgi:hypothetical protein
MVRSRPSVLLLLVLGPVLMGLWSCDKESHVASPFRDDDDDQLDTSLGALSGLVVNIAGGPLFGARVEVIDPEGGGTSNTGYVDNTGRFFVPGLAVDRTLARFNLAPQRYNTNFRRLRLAAGSELHFPRVMLLPVVRGPVFYASGGGSANVGTLGSGASFPDSAFVTAAGVVYTDRVAPYLAVTAAHEMHFAAAFPGEFVGERTDGSEVLLDALGALWLFVDSQAGTLDLAPDKAVAYRLGVDAGSDVPAPETALVWRLDTADGRWHEVGEAHLVDGVYSYALDSLGPICWANPAASVCEMIGVVLDNLDRPLANVAIDYRDPAGRFRQGTVTDEDGVFAFSVVPAVNAIVTPYFGSIVGIGDTINTFEACPYVLAEPLRITLPNYRIDLDWTALGVDLDAFGLYYLLDGTELRLQWAISYLNRGRLDVAPYAVLTGDARGSGPETINGRRWFDGKVEYWVNDYTSRQTAALRASGAIVDLVINERDWRFAVTDAEFDEAVSDTSGWWHVFDIVVDGSSVEVAPVQQFRPAPRRTP